MDFRWHFVSAASPALSVGPPKLVWIAHHGEHVLERHDAAFGSRLNSP
jgi:hypothetical protein